jgi:hypothetical protein
MKISGIITMTVSLVISVVSAYCTVVGMGKVFASAAYVTMFIASVIEVGRVVLVYDLHHYWHDLRFFQKVPGVCMLLIAICLSAMGIFGFMSNAHSQRTQEVVPIEMEITEKQQQIEILEQAIKVNEDQLKQYDGKAFNKYTEMGYVTKAVNLQKEQQQFTNKLYDDNREKQLEITKLNQEILLLKLSAEKKAPTLAHLKYYAKLFNVDNDTAIIIFIVMIMLVFDTLAMYLMITADWINSSTKPLGKPFRNDTPQIVQDKVFDERLETITKSLKSLRETIENNRQVNDRENDMKSYIQDALSKGFTSMSSEKDYIKDGMKSLIETIQGELSKISNNDNKSLIERLDKIEEKLLKNNIDNNEESDILLDKITEAIDNNADVINSERFSTMLEENPEVLRKLKIVYKNDNKVLKKLNKF